MQMCGGTSDVKDADAEIIEMCKSAKMKGALQEKYGAGETTFTPVCYKSQVVAGTNFFIKMKVDGGPEYIIARIFKPLPHTNEQPELHSIQKGKTVEDEITYF